jgi:hypothetical protein
MTEHNRSVREQRLESAEKRLGVANDALRTAHRVGLTRPHAGDGDPVQRAQELVITLEQEVALLKDSVDRDYAATDTTRT